MDVELPFSLKLEDFILERYPGSSSPSSYKSNVVLIDKENGTTMPYSIYMNHILRYKGWRFYQSSYDTDEQGTVLSVNKDFAGMAVTYAGYFILILFIVLSLINKNSSFRTVTSNLFKSPVGKTVSLIILMTLSSIAGFSQDKKFVVEKSRAEAFGKVLVQNQQGRTEPLYTLSNDILRKIARETEFEGYSAMQVFLGIYYDFSELARIFLSLKYQIPK
ncbi:MAG: cytochrome c biogenesis protein ResB [Marinilabiliales bacterium]|nr:cytochrome c biogenesis protein ResB [Marinilabiliales bacterium]